MGTIADKFQYLADTKNLIKAAIIGKGQAIASGDTFRSYATKIGSISSECTAIASNILSGKTAFSGGSKITGTIPNRIGATTSIAGHGTAMTVTVDPLDNRMGIVNLPNEAGPMYVDNTSRISAQLWGLIPSNIRAGQVVGQYFGYGTGNMAGTFTSDATAIASNILGGKTAYVNGNNVLGTMAGYSYYGLSGTTQGSNYFLPNGYHENGYVNVNIPNLVASNVKSGVNVGGVVGTAPTVAVTNKYIDLKCTSVYSGGGWSTGSSKTGYSTYVQFTGTPILHVYYDEILSFKYMEVIGGNYKVNNAFYVGSPGSPRRFNFSTPPVSGSSVQLYIDKEFNTIGTFFISSDAYTDAFYYDYYSTNSSAIRIYYDILKL